MRLSYLRVTSPSQTGFSLLEILITLVIASIGLLGMVALQTKSVSYTQDLVNKNNAIMLTHDLVNMMRSRPEDVFTSSISTTLPMYTGVNANSLFFKGTDAENFHANPVNMASLVCADNPKTSEEMRNCWLVKTIKLLPDADTLFSNHVHICRSTGVGSGCTPDTGSMIEIQLAWRVPEGTCVEGSNVCTLTSRVQL